MSTAMWIGLALLAGTPRPALQANQAAEAEQPAARSSEDWRRSLAGGDLDARLGVFDELVDTARREPGLRTLVEGWAREDGELGWTARLALRELDQAAEPQTPQPPSSPFGHLFGADPFDSFGGDPFGGAFGFRHPLGMPGGGFGASDLMRDMEERLGAMLAGPGLGQGALGGSSQSLRMESGPGGVRVEVEEQDGDGTRKKTYEAGSLEELLEQHPELRGRLQAGALEPGMRSDFRDLYDRLRERRGVLPLGTLEVPTDRLGILMREPGGWNSEVPGLDAGVGLYVERVYPGSLAAELGLRPGDVLTHLDGRALSGAKDVQAALAARQPTDRVTATVVDPSGERRELAWGPSPQRNSPRRDPRQL